MAEFLKAGELTQNKAGYLTKKDGKPVFHPTWVNAQKEAHFYVELEKAIQGKTFKAGKVDSFDAIAKMVREKLSKDQVVDYLKAPKQPSNKLQEQLVAEQLEWAKYNDTTENNKQINSFMQKFNIIKQVEEVGDFFEEGVVKLPAVYDIETIKNAVVAVLSVQE